MSQDKFVVFVVEGGIGKNITATVAVRCLKKQYPDRKLVVVAGYQDIFQLNPNVYRTYNLGKTPNFVDDYILGQDCLFLKTEPYLHPDYINQKGRHVSELWCEQLGVPFDNEKPELFFSKKEQLAAEQFVKSKNKPTLMVQFEGGMPPPEPGKPMPRMFVRNMPMETVKAVVDEFKATHHVFVARAATQSIWVDPAVETVSYPLRMTLALIPHVDKLLLIDSMMQHAAAAVGKPAVVCWSGTNPALLGYKLHTNLVVKDCPTPMCHRPNTYLFDKSTNDDLWACPFGEPCTLHKAEDIIQALRK